MILWILTLLPALVLAGFFLAMVTGVIRERTGSESAAAGYFKSWRG
ncbi:MAG: hypothetical protein ACYTDT_06650 [Planctomycetota bacterium]|jgi:hypothetical protein